MKPQDIVEFSKSVGKLKRIKRTGWIRKKINEPESVADHSFRLTVLCMVLAKPLRVDQEKLIKMAILHDLGEIEIGDIVIERGPKISPTKRAKREAIEKEVVRKLTGDLGDEYYDIFCELLERKSKEAKVLWQLDKLERAIQAKEYEEEQGKDLEEFFTNADMHMKNPLLKKILNLLKNQNIARQHINKK